MTVQDRVNEPSIEFALLTLARECEDAFAPLLAAKGATLEVAVALGAGKLRRGDPFRLRETLDLLLSRPTDGAETVRLFFSGRPERPLTIELSGVPPPTPRIRELVARMRGKIEDTPSDSIRLTLPFGTTDSSSLVRGPASSPAAPAPFAGLRFLIADDSPTNLMVMREMLANTGATITSVSNGAQALEAWRNSPLDMLLLDIAMPVMDGLTALRTIRAEEADRGLAHIPAVAVTANALSHQLDEYVQGGFDSHLAKPFRRQQLIDTISALRERA